MTEKTTRGENSPSEPPAPAEQPPSSKEGGAVRNTAQATAPGKTQSPQPPQGNGTAGNNAPTAAPQAPSGNLGRIVAATILGLCILLGFLFIGSIPRSCGGITGVSINDAGPEGGNILPPSFTLTEDEASRSSQCNTAMVGKGAGRWYMVYTAQDSHKTLAARLCVGNGKFRTAETARVVARTVYIREGGHEASGTIDTARKLSDVVAGKAYANVLESRSEKSFLFENPFIAFVDEGNTFDFCEQWKMKERPPRDDLVAGEIWRNCSMGGEKHVAVAKTISAADQEWLSKKDGYFLAAWLYQIEAKVAANGNRPVDPKLVDFSAPK